MDSKLVFAAIFLGTFSAVMADTWTQWFDRDNPSGTGDWETVSSLYSQYPTKMCKKPSRIQCRTTGGIYYRYTGQKLTCSSKVGLICKNADNIGSCKDYKVRFLCPN